MNHMKNVKNNNQEKTFFFITSNNVKMYTCHQLLWENSVQNTFKKKSTIFTGVKQLQGVQVESEESQPEVGSSPAVPINQVTGNDCSAGTWRRSNSRRSLKKRLMVRNILLLYGQNQRLFKSVRTCRLYFELCEEQELRDEQRALC